MSALNTVQVQLEMIQSKLGMSLNEAAEMIHRTKLTRPGDIRWMLQREYGLSHEDAKLLAQAALDIQTVPSAMLPPPAAYPQVGAARPQ